MSDVIMIWNNKLFLKDGQGDWGYFSEYMIALFNEPFWTPENHKGTRILFKHAKESKVFFRNEFSTPGCYIFGIEKRILYVGQTTRDLWTRLRGRYFIGGKTQYELSKRYEKLLIEKGISGFPPELVAEYKKQYHGRVRLEGAIMFARVGVQEVWFHLLPISNIDNDVLDTEQVLIRFCNELNIRSGYKQMLNRVLT
jgi:hypothetical protein